MALLKTYTISTDTAYGAVNTDRLHAEISSSGHVSNFNGLCVIGGNLEIMGDSLLDEPSLDALILAHEDLDLNEYKAIKIAAIKKRTGELLAVGFMFDTKTFPADINSNFNYNILKVNKASFTFPKDVGTITGETYSLTAVNVDDFWAAGKDFVEPILQANRELINSVAVAVDRAGVDAVQDLR